MRGIPQADWNRLIAALEGAHVLQTAEWGAVKAQYGWEPEYYLWVTKESDVELVHWLSDGVIQGKEQSILAAALVLARSQTIKGIRLPVQVLYVPKGPLLKDWKDEHLRRIVLEDLLTIAHQAGAVFIKIDPDVRLGTGIPGASSSMDDPAGLSLVRDLERFGWRFSAEQIQFRNTVMIDLTGPEESILGRMKQKTRYNIRLAVRKGVQVREGTLEDIDLLYRMYIQTAGRDGFVLREESYYRSVWSTFISAGIAKPLIAEVEAMPVAAVIPFIFAEKAWYLYGMSTDLHRDKMPNYLLQWEAMRLARQNGCKVYDLWGAPSDFSGEDPLKGVYRFKEGLGGEVVRYIGAWDLPLQPTLYRLYTSTLPRILDFMRHRGQQRIQRELGT